MNAQNQQPQEEPQTTVLHLNKFAPRKPGEPPTSTDAEETPTMIIRKAAENTAAQSPQPILAPRDGALPPKEMLGAVAYCYAKGVYRSEDIERKMMKDPKLRAALGNEVPDAKTIRRFRRNNRDAILATLGKYFRWFRARTVAQATAEQTGPPQPGGAGESTQYFVKTEAKDTLEKASWVDNMAKDD